MKEEAQSLLVFFEAALEDYKRKEYPRSSLLNEAISYSLEGRGKRVRPLFTLLVSEALGGEKESALEAALALEMIHTYSLVHDDMPILDDDDLRRGRKTVHVVFDEPTALLVGNSLLTDAFSLVSSSEKLSHRQKALMTCELSKASGSKGMVLGQALDVYWTGKGDYTKDDLAQIHLNKTGKLLGCAWALGALSVCPEDEALVNKCRKLGELLGVSFQIIDDLLDEKEGTGKSSGKDKEQGKLTYLSFYDRETCELKARKLTEEARTLFNELPFQKREPLSELMNSLLHRKF